MAWGGARLVDLRPGEGRLVFLASLVLFGLIGAHTMLETARDALFLGRLPPADLTYVYGALAGLTLATTNVNSRFVLAYGRRNALIFTLLFASFVTTMFFLAPRTEETVFALYLWSGLLGTVMVVQFWMFAGHLFTVTQGKRLFGLLAAGGVLGAVIGASVSIFAVEMASVELLLPCAAAALLVTALGITGFEVDAVEAPSRTSSRSPLDWRAGARALRDNPFLVRLGLLTAVATATVLTTDYMFKKAAAETFEAAELGAFFAKYYAVLNGVALLVQLFVAGAVVRRAGTIIAFMLLPSLLLLGAGGVILAGGGLSLILLAKGADGALRHSLHRICTELLWMPVPDSQRAKTKALIDAVIVRGAQAAAAFGLYMLSRLSMDTPTSLAVVVLAGAATWIVGAVGLRRPYIDLFRHAIHKDAPGQSHLQLDLRSVEVVVEALSSREPRQVISAIELLASNGRSRLIPGLILYHEADEVLIRALDIITTKERKDWVPLAERLLTHRNEDVRVQALKALARIGVREPLEGRLLDVSPTVRGQAAFWLADGDEDRPPQAHPAIQTILEMQSRAGRMAQRGLLAAIHASGGRRWADVLLHLAESDDEAVVEAACSAMASVRDGRFIPILIDRLGRRSGRSVVREALVALGEPALDALEHALNDRSRPVAVRLHVPRTISKFPEQRAADILIRILAEEPSGAIRYKALRGLGRMARELPVRIDAGVMERRANLELREYLRVLALAQPIEEGLPEQPATVQPSGRLLLGLLDDKMRQAMERVFRLLQIAHPGESIRSVGDALRSSDRQVRAKALEYLDALTLASSVPENRELLRIIGDDLDARERLDRSMDITQVSVEGYLPTLSLLIRERDESVAGLAAYHALELGEPSLSQDVELVSEERSLGGSLRSFIELMAAREAAGVV
jgi:AAA family ATP:ADP antiporter